MSPGEPPAGGGDDAARVRAAAPWFRGLSTPAQLRLVAWVALVIGVVTFLDVALPLPGRSMWTSTWTTAILGLAALAATLFSAAASQSSAATAQRGYDQ